MGSNSKYDMFEEDNDYKFNMVPAVRFKQLLRFQSLNTLDPLHESMLEMQQLAEEVGLEEVFDYDDNIDSIDLDI